MGEPLIFGVSDFVAVLNQTLELAYPFVTIEGELSNFRVARNRWVYFDLKDAESSLRFFGTVYALPGPLEDGMVVRVSGNPRLHPQYGFSVNMQSITPVGEGALRRAADLLAAKLAAEGLFEADRKRPLPYPPRRIGLITAGESAAYADFMKILQARWRGVAIEHFETAVQGEQAPSQLVAAIAAANALERPPEVLVLTRGGGSADDLAAFSNEAVVRAVAASRVPTLVAIGHEVDVSLAELAADQRGSTPSNAAELLTPDRQVVLGRLGEQRQDLNVLLGRVVTRRQDALKAARLELDRGLTEAYEAARQRVHLLRQLLEAYDPSLALQRGYALLHLGDQLVKRAADVPVGAAVQLQLSDGTLTATITDKELNNGQKD
jgi:exodeoxyribonuclease VII large subunit